MGGTKVGAKSLAIAVVLLLAAGPLLQWGPSERMTIPGAIEGTVVQGQAPVCVPASDKGMFSGIGDAFIENRGQLDDPGVLFYTQGGAVSVGLTATGIVVVIRDGTADTGPRISPGAGPSTTGATHFAISFEGCNDVRPSGRAAVDRTSNYFLGSDPTKWVRGAQSFREVVYEDIYDDVDIVLRLNGDALKYDILLGPGARVEEVTFKYEGILGLAIAPPSQDLLVSTKAGVLRDGRPVIFQDGALPPEGAVGRFVLHGDSRVGFGLPEGCVVGRPVLIDPGLIFSTFLGGSGEDNMEAMILDVDGNIIVCGETDSPDFPTTQGVYNPDGNVSHASADGFVAILNGTGWLICATFVGGSSPEELDDVVLDPEGTLTLVGFTNSSDFPVTGDALQKSLRGKRDGSMVRLSRDLSDLIYSSYYGGSGYDWLYHVDIGPGGRYAMVGVTNSSDVPTTVGAFCNTYLHTCDAYDSILILLLDGDLGRVDYCSYINGIESTHPTGYAQLYVIPVLGETMDLQGNLYLTGCTNQTTFPVTAGALRERYQGDPLDAFVVKFSPRGNGASDLLAATYLGGSSEDVGQDVIVLEDGRIAVCGDTNSTDFPLLNALDDRVEMLDGFIAILDSNLTKLEFGTYLGGPYDDMCNSLVESKDHQSLYVGGSTSSWNLNYTKGSFDDLPGHTGEWCNYIASFNLSDHSLEYCTRLGGSGSGVGLPVTGHQIMLANDGQILMHGVTHDPDFPTTSGAFQESYAGGRRDGFILKLDPTACGLPDPPRNLTAAPGDRMVTLRWAPHTNIGYRVSRYCIYRGVSPTALVLQENVSRGTLAWDDLPLTNGVLYYYGVSAVNSAGEGPMSLVQARPLRRPSPPQNLQLDTGDGAVNVSWDPPADTGGSLLGYHVLRGPTLALLSHLMTADADTLGYRDWDVTKGATYYYVVVAFNEVWNSTMAYKDIVPRSPPSAPIDLELVDGDAVVRLTWSPPTDDGGGDITAYEVHVRDARNNATKTISLRGDALTYEDHSVRNGGIYYYYVTATAGTYKGSPTEILLGRPFGVPLSPTGLNATPGDRLVHLTWSAPGSDNGRPVKGYVIYWGSSTGDLKNRREPGNVTYDIVPVPENGITYYFEVAAFNDAGEGLPCGEVSATPLGTPGMVTAPGYELQEGSVRLKWGPPSDTGGAHSLTYIVSKRMPDYTYSRLGEVVDGGVFVDIDVEVGKTYVYQIIAANSLSQALPAEVSVLVMWVPAAVTNMTVATGDGLIDLRWTVPESDGGSGITAYFIWKRSSDGTYSQLNWTLLLNYVDRDVRPGENYWYYIVARNAMGNGPMGRQQNATVLTHPGIIVELQIVYRDGAAELSWVAPSKQWGAPPTGYLVMRGTTTSDLLVIADLGLNQTYTDATVEKGIRYYYRVVAKSDLGQGDPMEVQEFIIPAEKRVPIATWAALALVIVVVVLAAILVAYARRRAEAASAAPTVHIVEEVLVVLADGRLIASAWREESRSRDADLMSGMLVAIQGIAREGLERGGMLRSIKYEDNTIVMAAGQQLYLAAVVYGNPDQALTDVLEATVQQVEAAYAPIIATWDGDPSVFAGIEDVLRPIIDRTAAVTREDVQRAGAAPRTVDLDV